MQLTPLDKVLAFGVVLFLPWRDIRALQQCNSRLWTVCHFGSPSLSGTAGTTSTMMKERFLQSATAWYVDPKFTTLSKDQIIERTRRILYCAAFGNIVNHQIPEIKTKCFGPFVDGSTWFMSTYLACSLSVFTTLESTPVVNNVSNSMKICHWQQEHHAFHSSKEQETVTTDKLRCIVEQECISEESTLLQSTAGYIQIGDSSLLLVRHSPEDDMKDSNVWSWIMRDLWYGTATCFSSSMTKEDPHFNFEDCARLFDREDEHILLSANHHQHLVLFAISWKEKRLIRQTGLIPCHHATEIHELRVFPTHFLVGWGEETATLLVNYSQHQEKDCDFTQHPESQVSWLQPAFATKTNLFYLSATMNELYQHDYSLLHGQNDVAVWHTCSCSRAREFLATHTTHAVTHVQVYLSAAHVPVLYFYYVDHLHRLHSLLMPRRTQSSETCFCKGWIWPTAIPEAETVCRVDLLADTFYEHHILVETEIGTTHKVYCFTIRYGCTFDTVK